MNIRSLLACAAIAVCAIILEHSVFATNITPGPNSFSCNVSATIIDAQCQAAPGAGMSLYITDVTMTNSATAQTVRLTSGTGTICATGLLGVYGVIHLGANSNLTKSFSNPIKLAANSALCCDISGVTQATCSVQGFIAP